MTVLESEQHDDGGISETVAFDPWTPPIRRSLPEILAERIVEAIRTGHLKPGERIVEIQLARQLGVSRGPLREALKALEANHIIESRRGRGSYVKQVWDEDLVRVVALRAGLEGLAARFVAARITPEEVEALSDRLAEMRRLAGEGRTSEWRDQDWLFHEAVCGLADNPFLLSAWRSISNVVRLFLHTHPGFVLDVPNVLSNHDEMLASLASGDSDRAEATFRGIILESAFARFGRAAPPALATITRETGRGARRCASSDGSP